jgi:Family of unknown function (DUF5989)
MQPRELRMSELKRQTVRARKGWFRRLFGDLLFVAKRDRKWWTLPLILLLLILAALLVFAVALGPLAPFIYPFL